MNPPAASLVSGTGFSLWATAGPVHTTDDVLVPPLVVPHRQIEMSSKSILRVTEAAAARGLNIDVHYFAGGTKTAVDAAGAIGCPVAAIVKSLVFMVDSEPVVALVPGDKRLDTERLVAVAGGGVVRRAGLDEVREATGFVAGGTPPFGYPFSLRVYADIALRREDQLWAAAGTPNSVFKITVAQLENVVKPIWADLSE